MSNNILTKIPYLLAAIIFFVWVLPQAMSSFSNSEKYEEQSKKLHNMAKMNGINKETQTFSPNAFKEDTKSLFSNVEIKNLSENRFEVNISLNKEDLEAFHTFIETLSLRYYVEIEDKIRFEAKENNVKVKMLLKAY